MKSTTIIVLLSLISLSFATVYFQENFDDASWKSRWVVSENKENLGAWEITSHPDDETNNKGLSTSEDYRFYQISSKFDSFSNKDETLVIQLSVAFPQRIDCGGGYIKLLPAGFDQKDFSGDSKYYVMFGPDICGSNKRTHAIINYKGENVEGSKTLKCDSDINTGVYTFIINPDQTYTILLDNVEISSGNIVDQWNVLPEKKINDPSKSKPKDWVDDEFIADPAATKPEGYDDIPAFIADPEATKPDDWDTELDGDWEAPLISNPEFQGPWEAPLIKNPEYKGEWEHPQIDNPDYAYDENIYLFKDIGGVGIEIWQVKSGTIFDNILITNDVALAKTEAERIVKQRENEIAHSKKVQEEEAAREAAEADRISEEFGEEEEEEEAHVHEEL